MDSCNFTIKTNSHTSNMEVHSRQKLCHQILAAMLRKRSSFCPKSFVPVTRAQAVHAEKIFMIPGTEISVAKAN